MASTMAWLTVQACEHMGRMSVSPLCACAAEQTGALVDVLGEGSMSCSCPP